MFLLVLLVSRATCEWVQISQQHYRKPLRTHNIPFDETTQLYFEQTTKTNRIYLNHTIGAHTWNKGNVNKVPKLGNVQRVQLDGNFVKAPNIRVIENNRHDIKELSATAISHSDKQDEDEMNFKGIVNEHTEVPINIERPSSNSVRVKNTLTDRKVSVGSLDKPLKKLVQVNDNSFHRNPGNADNSMGFRTSTMHTNKINVPTHAGSGFSKVKPNPLFNIENDETFVDEVININSFKDLDNVRIDQTNANKGESFIKETTSSHRKENKSNSIIKKDEEYFNNERKTENPFTTNEPNAKRNKTSPNRHNTKIYIDETKENESVKDNQRSEESSSETKSNTVVNLMKFMKVISDTIRRNTRRGVNSKTRYLQNLKDTILANIEERIESAWPSDAEPRTARRRREARGHHLEIPSSESALMTISFLTFAVFLIKLVLQVIQTYKNKAMMVTPAVVATVGRATAARSDHD